ncbi:MAG: GNAT family N-acetyltransferase [Solirubrobacterales bacterium]
MTFTVEWVAEVARLAALAAEWDALVTRNSRPFDLHCWHMAWLAAFGGSAGQLAICTVREDGALAGVLPLIRDGRRLEAMANVHSCFFRPLARSPEAMDALIDAALQDVGAIELVELPDGDPSLEHLTAGMRRAGMVGLFEPGSVSPIVDTSGELDAWVKANHASWKKRLRRYHRKMEKDFEASFEIAKAPADLEAELSRGLALEASGWKGSAGTAIVSQPETEAFYREIAACFDARGELRLSRVELDGELVVFSLCIEQGGRLYSLKAGYDERFRKLVPGLVLQLSIVEHCFERGIGAYELLGERTEWKDKLATGQRSHFTLRGYRRNPAGLAKYSYRSVLRPRLRRIHHRFAGSA